jgi:ferrochelatase
MTPQARRARNGPEAGEGSDPGFARAGDPKLGALLVNLGTPASPRVSDVRRYLREFLGDPRVLDLPAPARWLLLNLVILPLRPRRSAAAYAKVWLPEGSPLLVHGRALAAAVAAELGPGAAVELAMRYGEPSIRGALARLVERGAQRIVALPLFPQFSQAATGSARARIREEWERLPSAPPLEIRGAFFADPGFLAAWVAAAGPDLARCRPDHVLFSYHGLPERQVRAADPGHCLASPHCCEAPGAAGRDCYRAQCFATTRALAAALGLAPGSHSLAFQSRLGRTPWIGPHTDRCLPELAARGVRRLAVLCPSFVADCLETLEEIGIRARAQWQALGGEELALLPSLNAHPAWVRAVCGLLRREPARG